MSLKLLLLDDHKVFSESLKHLFESQGFEVFNITNPIMAFGVLKTQKIDLNEYYESTLDKCQEISIELHALFLFTITLQKCVGT